MAFVTSLRVLPSSTEHQRLTANKRWLLLLLLLLEVDQRIVPNHSCELNVSLCTQSCCTESLSFLSATLFSQRSLLLPALPGCPLLPVRLCPSGGFGLPLEIGRLSHWRWCDVGLVGRSDGGADEGQKQGSGGGPCHEKAGCTVQEGGAGDVRLIQRWLSKTILECE